MKNYFLEKLYAFSASSQQELLAGALVLSEDKERLFRYYSQFDCAEGLAAPSLFTQFASDESQIQERLTGLYKAYFGSDLQSSALNPLQSLFFCKLFKIRQQNTLLQKALHRVIWLEKKSLEFYQAALKRVVDLDLRNIFKELSAQAQQRKATLKLLLAQHKLKFPHFCEQERVHKEKLLTLIQPGLAGLMDGSVSTLAPIFAAAFATGNTKATFLIGLSASIGAGISMGFTEAIHDDGKISGRGSPVKRGLASGIMTTIGGLGHTLPYLLNDFNVATTIAILVVFIELWAIVWVQNKFMKISFWRAATQVVLGGALVFAAGIIIGKS